MQVWKYQLEVQDVQQFPMPAGAELLHVAMQGGVPCVWAKVDPSDDPNSPQPYRSFRIVGTGPTFDDTEAVYVGTFQMGPLVFHVFDLGETR